MTSETSQRTWSDLDLAKIVAGTLSAVTAAVCASVLGVAGTLIGAGVASLVATVGQELYARSLRHGYQRLRDPRRTRVSASAATPGTVPAHDEASGERQATTTTLHSSAARVEAPTAGSHPDPGRGDATAATRLRWKRIAVATLAAFALAMVVIGAVELIAGRSLAGMFGDENAGRTTFSSVVDGPPSPAATPAPGATPDAPATAPGGGPARTATPSAALTAEPPVDATQPAPEPAPTGPAPTAGP
jgi:hypothetical protein